MRRIAAAALMCAVMSVTASFAISDAHAEEIKMVGTIVKLELSADGASAVAVLQDKKSGAAETIIISDEQTMDKFKDKRIVEGDEIRSKFEKTDGKNVSKVFKKTAGC